MTGRADGIAYEAAGDGPPLLLLHGEIGDRRMWDPQWERFASGHRAIRFDARGYGESEDPSEAWSPVDDAVAVLDAAGADRAAVVGVSDGGRVALDLALDWPDRISALVMVSAVPSGWPPAELIGTMLNVVESACEGGQFDIANEVDLQLWVDGPQRKPGGGPAEVRERVGRVNRELLERACGYDAEPVAPRHAAAHRIETLEPPLLLVVGSLDHEHVHEAASWLEEWAGAARHDIDDAAHLPNLERPDEFADVIEAFLGERA
jgi:pimeloyl-ACP methyl ester carboxylesterase